MMISQEKTQAGCNQSDHRALWVAAWWLSVKPPPGPSACSGWQLASHASRETPLSCLSAYSPGPQNWKEEVEYPARPAFSRRSTAPHRAGL